MGFWKKEPPTTYISLGWSRWTAVFRSWAEHNNIVPPGLDTLRLVVTGIENRKYASVFWGGGDNDHTYTLSLGLWTRATLEYLSRVPAYRGAHVSGNRLKVSFYSKDSQESLFYFARPNYTFPSYVESMTVEEAKPGGEHGGKESPKSTTTIYDALLEQE